ncbi:MAG: peroxiredoxin [Aigarchaeota archaeon]|nr:peroxiredoxin [Aigarchaeota archaeon]MDW8092599.1 peroxiredoxin [Nitrososphaerota archaeon]
MLKVGDLARDFTLPDQNRQLRSLSEFKGKKLVLAFFPGAFTSVCTKEMCRFRDDLAKLKQLNADVIGVSVNDPFTLKAFDDANKLGFPLLSDHTRSVSREYSGLHEDFVGLKGYSVAKRAVFVLDSSQRIRYAWISDNPGVEPNYAEINKALSEIT